MKSFHILLINIFLLGFLFALILLGYFLHEKQTELQKCLVTISKQAIDNPPEPFCYCPECKSLNEFITKAGDGCSDVNLYCIGNPPICKFTYRMEVK